MGVSHYRHPVLVLSRHGDALTFPFALDSVLIYNWLEKGAFMDPSFDIDDFDCVLRGISESVSAHAQICDIAALVAEKTTNVLNAKGALVWIRDPETRRMGLCTPYGVSQQELNEDRIISSDLSQSDTVTIIDDVLQDPRVQHPQEVWEEGIRMMAEALLVYDREIKGVLRVCYGESRELSEIERNLLIFNARHGACAIEKIELIRTQQSQFDHLALQTEKLAALGQMAAGIAHEINNPLGGILLRGSNLIKKVPEEGPIREGLEVIINEAKRCKDIIQGLLEFSRERVLKPAPVDINLIIEKAVRVLKNEFRLGHVQVVKRLSLDMEDILVDENQVQQVFVNLLLNAVEAIDGQGVITINSHMDKGQDRVRVEIEDTGCGICPEYLSKIFDPFFSTKPKGTGLGLAVSYGIVQSHGGNIQVFSEPGGGTRFTVDFPLPHTAQPEGL